MSTDHLALATLGGGCFWCLEPVFEELTGVENVVVGYAGGSVENPTYGQVGRGDTGHAEVVQVTFDPGLITFEDLLRVFFSIHDPSTPNRQGADVGPQYRSLILAHDAEQDATARELIAKLNEEGLFRNPIVTEIQQFESFHMAEDYHQDYYEKNPYAGYCLAVITPKMAKFRKAYSQHLKDAAPEPN